MMVHGKCGKSKVRSTVGGLSGVALELANHGSQ